LEQPAPQVLPDSQARSNGNDLNITQDVQLGAKPATVSSRDASEGISLALNGVSDPSTRPSGVGSDVARPSIERSKTVAEQQPVVLANPNAKELAQQQEQKEVSDLKTPTLAKLEVRSATPTNNSESEAPPSIAYIERKPEIIRLVNPKFPTAAWNAGVEGEVVVKVQIGTDGKPIQAKIVKSCSELFNDAVIEAVLSSQFSPRIISTGPVTTWLQMPFTFKRKAN
jgi:protein TonB